MTGGWDRLTPEGEKFFRQIDELQDKEVFVGFQAGKVTDDRGVDMAQIAMWNELGTSTAPSRPFLRKSVDENADPINAMCAQQLKAITAGGTAEHAANRHARVRCCLAEPRNGDNPPRIFTDEHGSKPNPWVSVSIRGKALQ